MHIKCQDGPGRVGLPFTVILMLPDDLRGDEASEADWVRRMWITAPSYLEAMDEAIDELAYLLEWSDDPEDDDYRDFGDLVVVSVYSGHQIDLFVETTP